MSQRHRTVESILQMINSGYYNESDIYQALADLEAMKDNISNYTYKNVKALLESKL